jgi:hypothetical protein
MAFPVVAVDAPPPLRRAPQGSEETWGRGCPQRGLAVSPPWRSLSSRVPSYCCGRSLPAVTQPVAFNHLKHTKDLGLACAFCHQYVMSGAHAGLPQRATCAMCHQAPQGESPEAARLTELLAAGAPVNFNKLFRLPDHVNYTHRRHVGIAKLECPNCHGAIAETPSRPLGRWCESTWTSVSRVTARAASRRTVSRAIADEVRAAWPTRRHFLWSAAAATGRSPGTVPRVSSGRGDAADAGGRPASRPRVVVSRLSSALRHSRAYGGRAARRDRRQRAASRQPRRPLPRGSRRADAVPPGSPRVAARPNGHPGVRRMAEVSRGCGGADRGAAARLAGGRPARGPRGRRGLLRGLDERALAELPPGVRVAELRRRRLRRRHGRGDGLDARHPAPARLRSGAERAGALVRRSAVRILVVPAPGLCGVRHAPRRGRRDGSVPVRAGRHAVLPHRRAGA